MAVPTALYWPENDDVYLECLQLVSHSTPLPPLEVELCMHCSCYLWQTHCQLGELKEVVKKPCLFPCVHRPPVLSFAVMTPFVEMYHTFVCR